MIPNKGIPQGQAGSTVGWNPPGTCRYSMPPVPLSPGWLVGVCSHREMRLSWVLTVPSICVSALVTATGTEGKRKLQIGVKKRVDHCPIKSRKGDVLHMHYTVGEGGALKGFGDLKGNREPSFSAKRWISWASLLICCAWFCLAFHSVYSRVGISKQ